MQTTVYLTMEQVDQLHVLHEATNIPVAVYIRQGVDMILNINKPNLALRRMQIIVDERMQKRKNTQP